MDKNEEPSSPAWGASFFIQTTEDVARAVVAATSAATVRSPRPSVVFSSREEDGNSPIKKLQNHVTRVLRGFSPSPEVKKRAYNPEILTSQKRQWARFQLQSLDQRSVKEPSRLFESLVVVGLHPNTDVQTLLKQIVEKSSEETKKSRSLLNYHHQVHAELNLEPQVLFVYPPEKQLPLKYKDLLSFCFPAGPEVHAVERTPSLSELNEIILGQEQIKQSDQSFVFRLQVADDSTLYGCCVLVEEIIQKPSNLISMLSEEQPSISSLSRYIITTPRCYCILSRLPFFDLHFGILRSIFTEERLERLTKGIDMLNLLTQDEEVKQDTAQEESNSSVDEQLSAEDVIDLRHYSNLNPEVSLLQRLPEDFNSVSNPLSDMDLASELAITQRESGDTLQNGHNGLVDDASRDGLVDDASRDGLVDDASRDGQPQRHLPDAVLPLIQQHHSEGSEFSSSFQGSPWEERSYRSGIDDADSGEPSSSGQEDTSRHNDILKWAKANNHGSLQIICEYFWLQLPARGSTLTFQPLEHLHPIQFHRPCETVLHIAGSTIDVRSCGRSVEVAEAHSALLAEEEATALSVWTVACICGNLRLEHVMTMFAGALLEKQIVVVCSNLGILSASVLSIVPLIRPYQWQSLLMPVLPNDMLDFLDAPVPYIVGIKSKTAEIHSKLSNVILIDANKNQVRSPSMPQLPQHKQLFSSLSPYHAKLVGESYLARKRPVHECTDVQVEAAKGFLAVLRSYLDSLCSNMRSHTITNVQSNDDKVSLLLKESFIDSFPYRDRSFMKLFVDTQLFSVHTDLVLSFYQKD